MANRTKDEMLGYAPGTVERIFVVERALEGLGIRQSQQILGAALFRTTARHPSFALQEDFDVDQIVIRDGGRDVRVEVRVFPPRDTSVQPYAEPSVKWRGSVSDLATDLAPLLGPAGVTRLIDELTVALKRGDV